MIRSGWKMSMKNLKLKSKYGFTLIELLVVISVIGLLASVILVSLNSARAKARDAKRLTDMRQMVTALGLYYDKYNLYPSLNGELNGGNCGGWDTSQKDEDTDGKQFIESLVDDGFVSKTPSDPLDIAGGAGCGGYDYYLYPAGYEGCDSAKGDFFVLGVRNMEGVSVPHPASPGWSCPTRDWQVEFDWVTGGFTR